MQNTEESTQNLSRRDTAHGMPYGCGGGRVGSCRDIINSIQEPRPTASSVFFDLVFRGFGLGGYTFYR